MALTPNLGLPRKLLLDAALTRWLWGEFRRFTLLRDYERRRDEYAKQAERRGLAYDRNAVITEVRARVAGADGGAGRGQLGDIHTFAFIPDLGWHFHLLPDLKEIGPLSHFDYVAHGYSWTELAQATSRAADRLTAMNALFLKSLRAAHRERPVHWVFIYGTGLEILPDTLRCIRDELGLPTVNMCLDDKQSWIGPRFQGKTVNHHGGQKDLAGLFDLVWTSARVALDWYLVEGGRAVFLPEGFDSRTFHPVQTIQDIPVSFIGAAYGFRRRVITRLRRAGVPIQVFGASWGGGAVSNDEQVTLLSRSRINLGMGGIGYAEFLTNVKGRDFEIPGAGGGIYITTYNPDLAEHFDIGREIVCYGNPQEMVELLRYYLARPTEAAEISRRARVRCLREHRWLHRYQTVLEILGLIEESGTERPARSSSGSNSPA